jgi:hypothetical protein
MPRRFLQADGGTVDHVADGIAAGRYVNAIDGERGIGGVVGFADGGIALLQPGQVLAAVFVRLLSLPPAVMLNALSEPDSAAAITSE